MFDTGVKIKKFNMASVIKQLEDTRIQGRYSIGGGNHFIELQSIERVLHKEHAKELALDKTKLHLMIHSGSRSLGEEIYRSFASFKGYRCAAEEFQLYLKAHEEGVITAKENRKQLAQLFMNMLNYKYTNSLLIDCVHNYLEIHKNHFYHHKGTVSALENRFALITGSRGSYSYVVRCIPKEEALFSISHGAGRKWARGMCRGKLEQRYTKEQLKRSKLGSIVITNDKVLLYEEAAEAYKNIEEVIAVLQEYGCIEVIVRMKPIVTYKG